MRARLALVACALWLTGVEGLPALHEALHHHLAPHHHAHGSIVTVTFADTAHRHADGTVHAPEHDRGAGDHPAPSDGAPRTSSGPDHAGGLAHHAAAIAPAAPPIIHPLPIDRRPTQLAVPQAADPVACDPLAATARGPPALA